MQSEKTVTFAWLEITGKCQLECGHCYADSGPRGDHGVMQLADWRRVIDELADADVKFICIIGGEPTMHPDLNKIVEHALDRGMMVEVYSNLVRVADEHWQLFERDGVSLATSYYSSDPQEHARVVGRQTFERTTANIQEARRRDISIRVGMVQVLPTQQIAAASRVLGAFGIKRVGFDDLRGVGRGLPTGSPDCSALCGRCADKRIAITPDGTVFPCVFSRWMPVGNVLESSLGDILRDVPLSQVRAELAGVFAERSAMGYCVPDDCQPSGMADCGPQNGECHPSGCQPNLPKRALVLDGDLVV